MKKLEKLGKYELRRELGRGAMGVVYEAFDPLIERTVAIKTILKSTIDKSEAKETFSRFRREARAAGRLSHPKIVSIYEYGEDDDMAFIAMELIRGKELKEYFDHEDRFSIRDGIRIVMQILDALDFSHARGVIHRDIKPANILITDDGQIKIADFGIAKIDSTNLTQVGVVLGTPSYMPPEQFLGQEVDHRADIYATGVILYQFLTGKRPFTGSVITIMHQAVHQDAIPPSQLNPDVSKQLDEVVKKAMAKRPADRFQSATDFMQALKAVTPASSTLLHKGSDPDITMGDNDETIVLPISSTLAKSAQSRIESLEKTSALALEEERQNRLKQEAQTREEEQQNRLKQAAQAQATLEETKKNEAGQRKADINAWQRITNSRLTADFHRYLQEFPAGEYAELARLRIESLEKASALALEAERQTRLKHEAQARAALEEKQKKAAEQREAAERALAQAKAQAEAEANRQIEAAKKARLASQLAEIKSEAEISRAAEAVKREKEIAEQMQRAIELSASMPERVKKFAEVVAVREAENEAERKMKEEARRKLEEEVQRKKQAKMRLLEKKEAAETKKETNVEEMRQREAAELAARNQELAEAKTAAAIAEQRRKEAEARIAQTHRKTRLIVLTVGAVLAVLLVGILFELLSSAK